MLHCVSEDQNYVTMKSIRKISNMKAENKAWCEDLINFIKIFNMNENLLWGLLLMLWKEPRVSLKIIPKKSFPFYSFCFICLREELRENISFSS